MSGFDLNRFKILYLEHASELIYFARKFVDVPVAEDMIQDVFVKLWDNLIDLSDDRIKSYLYKCVRNACLDYLKHQDIKHRHENYMIQELKIQELIFYDDPIKQLMKVEEIESIYQAIEKLPAQCRNIFEKAYLQNYRHNDIAIDLNISVRTVENQVYKALKAIRMILNVKKENSDK